MQTPEAFPHVYRLNDRPEYKGRLCRIVKVTPYERDRKGVPIIHTGEEPVALEFEDGTRMMSVRLAVIFASSRPGKQLIWRAQRGGARFRRSRSGRPSVKTIDNQRRRSE